MLLLNSTNNDKHIVEVFGVRVEVNNKLNAVKIFLEVL